MMPDPPLTVSPPEPTVSGVRVLVGAGINHLVLSVVKLASISLRGCGQYRSDHVHWEAAEPSSTAGSPRLQWYLFWSRTYFWSIFQTVKLNL